MEEVADRFGKDWDRSALPIIEGSCEEGGPNLPALLDDLASYFKHDAEIRRQFASGRPNGDPVTDHEWARLRRAYLWKLASGDSEQAVAMVEEQLNLPSLTVPQLPLGLDPFGTKVIDEMTAAAESERDSWIRYEAERESRLDSYRVSGRRFFRAEHDRAEVLQIWGRRGMQIRVFDYLIDELNRRGTSHKICIGGQQLSDHFSPILRPNSKPFTKEAAHKWLKDLLAYGIISKVADHRPARDKTYRRPATYTIRELAPKTRRRRSKTDTGRPDPLR